MKLCIYITATIATKMEELGSYKMVALFYKSA